MWLMIFADPRDSQLRRDIMRTEDGGETKKERSIPGGARLEDRGEGKLLKFALIFEADVQSDSVVSWLSEKLQGRVFTIQLDTRPNDLIEESDIKQALTEAIESIVKEAEEGP